MASGRRRSSTDGWEAFRDQVAALKERGARLVTMASVRETSGETALTYYFEVDGELSTLTVHTLEGSTESLYSLFSGADVVEREIHQLFGVKFVGNPNLGVKS